MDKGIKKYDHHVIAEAKMNAIINYREAKRMFNSLTRIKDEKEKARYLHYRFLTNEKHAVKDAEAKAKIGRFLKRDHTTVLHHLKHDPINIDKILENDDN